MTPKAAESARSKQAESTYPIGSGTASSVEVEVAQSDLAPSDSSQQQAGPMQAGQQLAAKSQAKQPSNSMVDLLRKQWIAVALVAACLLIAVIVMLAMKEEPGRSSIATSTTENEKVGVSSVVKPTDAERQESIDDELTVMPTLDGIHQATENSMDAAPNLKVAPIEVDLAALAQSRSAASANGVPNESKTDEELTESLSEDRARKNGLHESELTEKEIADKDVAANEGANKEMPSAELTSGTPVLAETDVMREVSALASGGEASVDSELNATGNNDPSMREPFVLATSPLMQTFKLPPKLIVRMKHPVWQIQLSVDNEFDVSPAEPQVISDKQPTTWLITSSDAKAPRSAIVIQAQAMPGRQAGLRWRVFAGAEDVPALMLPLSREVLPVIQQRVRAFASAAQLEVERLKQAVAVATKEDRMLLSKQRTAISSQLKLANRITEVAAEMKMLNDQLRNQVTVYATLRDGPEPDAAVALQFGDFEADQAEQAEAQKTDAEKAEAEKDKATEDEKAMQAEESPSK